MEGDRSLPRGARLPRPRIWCASSLRPLNAHLSSAANQIDLYGKGYSEAPKTAFDATLFVVQLALLLQYIRWDAAHVVGFSMGGGVAAAFASSVPHLVAGKIVFISAAGLLTVSPAAVATLCMSHLDLTVFGQRLSAPNPVRPRRSSVLCDSS